MRRAAASFKGMTSCPCGPYPKHLGMLSDDLLKVIASQSTLWEKYGQLIVTLISKPDEGLIPIALYRAAYRVLARVKGTKLQDWAAKLDCCYTVFIWWQVGESRMPCGGS